jgi:hypothetical protein
MRLSARPLWILTLLMLVALATSAFADNQHSLRMVFATTAVAAASEQSDQPPCHQTNEQESTTHAEELDAESSMPCCPDQSCSLEQCLMHLTVASMDIDMRLPTSVLISQTFNRSNAALHSRQLEQRLRPPIA